MRAFMLDALGSTPSAAAILLSKELPRCHFPPLQQARMVALNAAALGTTPDASISSRRPTAVSHPPSSSPPPPPPLPLCRAQLTMMAVKAASLAAWPEALSSSNSSSARLCRLASVQSLIAAEWEKLVGGRPRDFISSSSPSARSSSRSPPAAAAAAFPPLNAAIAEVNATTSGSRPASSMSRRRDSACSQRPALAQASMAALNGSRSGARPAAAAAARDPDSS
ncbi:unnamed protein product, partial [Ectocarpus fasciculatus]